MSDIARYESLQSSWTSADDVCNWIIHQLDIHHNGEPIDNYCLNMAVRNLICMTLIDISKWDIDRAMEFVSQEGKMIAKINEDEELGRHLVIGWQPTGAQHAEVFVYALDIHATDGQDE